MNYEISRKKMVQEQIANPPGDRRPIGDRRVIDAMLRIPRHIFVQEAFAAQAYSDTPLHLDLTNYESMKILKGWDL